MLKELGMDVWQLTPEFRQRLTKSSQDSKDSGSTSRLEGVSTIVPDDVDIPSPSPVQVSDVSPLSDFHSEQLSTHSDSDESMVVETGKETLFSEQPTALEEGHLPRSAQDITGREAAAEISEILPTNLSLLEMYEETPQKELETTPPSVQQGKLSSSSQAKSMRVFIGEGLDSIWDNDQTPEGRLLEQLVKALSWENCDVIYYDTANLHSDEAIFTTLDEIIDAGVEAVFSFDEGGELLEHLSEGVNVVLLPSLTNQLQSGSAKKSCYAHLIQYG